MPLSKRVPRVSWTDKDGVPRSYTFQGDEWTSYHPQWVKSENEFTHPFTKKVTRDLSGYYLTVTLGVDAAEYVTRDKFAWGGMFNAGNSNIMLHVDSDVVKNIYTDIVSATSTTVVVSGIVATLNQYAGESLKIISGDGIGQVRNIVSNTATSGGNTTFVVSTWTVTPEAADRICINNLNEESYEVDMGDLEYDDFLGNIGRGISIVFRSKNIYEQPANPPDDVWGNRTLDFTADINFNGV